MRIGILAGLGFGAAFGSSGLPQFLGFASGLTGSPPSMPTVAAGDLCLMATARNSQTIPEPTTGSWNYWSTIPFNTGTAAFLPGETLTQGGVTATIYAVNKTSGDWGTSDAAGDLTIYGETGGAFAAGAATSASGAANLTAAKTFKFTAAGVGIGLFWKYATSGAEAVGSWSNAGRLLLWTVRNAAIDRRQGNANGSGANTSVNYQALPYMAPNCVLGAAAIAITTQTSVAAMGPVAAPSSRYGVPNTTHGGIIAADSLPSYASAFAGETRTLDTASAVANVMFSLKRKAA